MSAPRPEPGAAERAFAEFLEGVESGAADDFDAFCAQRGALAPALRRMHASWSALDRAFGQVGTGPTAPVTPGERLERYELRDEIARGGMGRIVRAYDRELRRDVALKLQRGDASDPRRRRRFLEEAQIAAQLDHPGIVPVHELGRAADGRPYFTMQLVRGQDLAAVFALANAGDPEWSRTRVLHVLLRVCEAVAFAHARGVVHRDLKPHNVMIGRFGETYVMDWGLASVLAAADDADRAHDRDGADDGARRPNAGVIDTVRRDLADSDPGDALRTRDGDILGTPAYMAPEQALGQGAATPAIDIYAVGAMLYELLAGRAAYVAAPDQGADTVLQQVRHGPPPPLPDSLAPELRAICERAMARDPAQRYPDMLALAADLRAFLEVRTVRAYATGPLAELRKWVLRNRALAIAAAAFVVALAIAAAAMAGLWFEAERSRAETAVVGDQLRASLARSSFRAARQALQSDNSRDAGDALWRAHLAGELPRATAWALLELAEHDPYLATVPLDNDYRPVAVCPDLHAVLLGRVDGVVELRDDTTLALRAELGERGAPVTCLCVLDEPHRAVVGTTTGELRIVAIPDGTVLRSTKAHGGSLRAAVPAGDRGLVTTDADGTVLHWQDADAAPRELLTFPAGVTAVAVRPLADGVFVGDEQGHLRGVAFDGTWHVELGVGARITALAFGAHKDELWVGCNDHRLRRFDFSDPKRQLSLPTRNGTCRQLARDADGSLLVGGWWRIDRVDADGALRGAAALRGISRWAFDAAQHRLVTSGLTCGLGVVDLSQRDRRRIDGAGTVALSGDGHRFAVAQGGRAVVRDVATGEALRRLPAGSGGHLRLDPTGTLLAACSGSPRSVRVFDVDRGEPLVTLRGPTDDPFGDAFVFAPDGSEAAVVVGADRIERYDRGGQQRGELAFDGTAIRLAYSADARLLAAIGRNSNVVRLYDLARGTFADHEFHAPPSSGETTALAAVALSPDARRLAVGTWQGIVMVRDLLATDAPVVTLAAHAGTIWSLGFDRRDPDLLLTSGGSQGVACWDLDSGECCYQAIDDVAQQVQLSDDGSTLACIVPGGALLLDLTYRRRHVAGTLADRLARLRGDVAMSPAREAELRAWSAAVLAEPWPRWR